MGNKEDREEKRRNASDSRIEAKLLKKIEAVSTKVQGCCGKNSAKPPAALPVLKVAPSPSAPSAPPHPPDASSSSSPAARPRPVSASGDVSISAAHKSKSDSTAEIKIKPADAASGRGLLPVANHHFGTDKGRGRSGGGGREGSEHRSSKKPAEETVKLATDDEE